MRPGLDLRLAGPVAAAWAALALLVGAPRAVAGWAGAAGLAAAGLLWRFGGQRRWVSPVALSLLVAGVFAAALAVQGGAWERSAVVRAAAQGGRAEVVLRLSEPAKARASPWGGDPSALARGVVWLLPAAAASAGSGAGAGAGAAAAGADSGAGGAVGAVGGSQAAGAVGAIRGPGVPALAYLEGEPPAAGAVAVFRGRLSLAQPADQERVVIEALEPAAVSAPTGWRGLVYRLRAGLLERASPLLAGITLGDTSGVEEELDAALKTTSLTHITAVSGAHVAIVLGLVLGLAALAGAPRWLAAGLGAATLVAFAGLIGPGPSVLRAVLMGGAAVLGLASGKARLALGALAGAAALALVANPWLARSYGLILSALATGALIVIAPPLADWLGRVFPRLPRAVAEAAALTGSAQLVCAPVITIFAGQISLVALPANLLAAPAIPVTTVAGLAALALGAAPPALAALAGAAVWAGNAAAAWVAWVAQWVATWPLAAVPWPSGAAGFALAGAATVVLVVALRLLARAPGWARRAVAAGLIVALAVAGPLRRPVNNALGRGPPGDWALAVCDVGQGTAVALRSGEDSAIMVDVGPEGGGVGDCLAELGVERLDAVIVTHFHADHVGGLAEALDGRALGELVRGPACGEAAAAEQAVRLAQEAGAATREVGQIGALGGAAGTAAASPARGSAGQVQFAIYPPALAALCPSQASGSQESAANNASLAVFAQADGLDVWVLGDLEREGQEALLADLRSAGGAAGAGGTASSTQIPGLGGVVVVAHHGSANQSEALARALAPRVAVMSAGRDNPYGHPTDKAIALYGQSAEIRRTDQEGLIALTGAGGSAGANLVG